MTSKRPAAPAPLVRPKEVGLKTIRETFSVATPVFGGGVRIDSRAPHIKKIDEVTPVRGASIRGQLRFWWRATHGSTCENIEKMREREERIWGAASQPGNVALVVREEKRTIKPVRVYRDDKPKIAEKDMYDVAYGAFALQPGTQYKGNDTKAGTLTRLEGTFTLELTVPPEFEEEVRDAVTAWLLFGGIGGRTRRGFGTLRPDLPVEVKTFLDKFKEEKTLSLVPSLHNAKFKLRPAEFDKPDEAWKKALERLRSFRQGIGTGRKNGTGNDQPGRSLWPEADLIRAMTGSAAPNHQKPVVDVKKAPRVAFGMPIIVHFKDVDKGDPEDTRFLPRDRERMASPVIVKAMPVTRNGQTKWQAGCLLLSVAGRNEIQVELHHDKEKLGSVDWRLSKPEAEQIAALKGRSHDVLDAFLEYFQGN